MSLVRRPSVKWAQRTRLILIAVCVESPQIELLVVRDGSHLQIKCQRLSDGAQFECSIELFAEVVDCQRCSQSTRQIDLVLIKQKEAWWPRLTASASRDPRITVDFQRWRDEDEIEHSTTNAAATEELNIEWTEHGLAEMAASLDPTPPDLGDCFRDPNEPLPDLVE